QTDDRYLIESTATAFSPMYSPVKVLASSATWLAYTMATEPTGLPQTDGAVNKPVWKRERFCQQYVDHSLGPRSKRFCQNYYYTEHFVSKTGWGPSRIFVGTSNMESADPEDVEAEMMYCASALDAIPVFVETRFSGSSLPVKDNSTSANLKELYTYSQMIGDIDRLVHHLRFFSGVIADGTKEFAKIALFGHDHTGRIAAWGAMAHRHTFNAAVSSSTPVKSVIENKEC
ncbi:hypothetical protein FOZ62_011171, partial [Perkinsus olseni]